jgi:hypothetical protein
LHFKVYSDEHSKRKDFVSSLGQHANRRLELVDQ